VEGHIFGEVTTAAGVLTYTFPTAIQEGIPA